MLSPSRLGGGCDGEMCRPWDNTTPDRVIVWSGTDPRTKGQSHPSYPWIVNRERGKNILYGEWNTSYPRHASTSPPSHSRLAGRAKDAHALPPPFTMLRRASRSPSTQQTKRARRGKLEWLGQWPRIPLRCRGSRLDEGAGRSVSLFR